LPVGGSGKHQVTREKLKAPEIGDFGGYLIEMLASRPCEGVILTMVIVNSRHGILPEDLVNHVLRRLRAVLVLTGYVKQERTGQIRRFIQHILDPNPVVTHRGIGAVPGCHQIRQFAAQAKADCSDRAFTCLVLTECGHR